MKTFNISKIEKSFRKLKKDYASINNRLTLKRDEFNEGVIENIIYAYEYINELLKENVDLFNPMGLYSMLELNHIILCGKDKEKRIEYYHHINETRIRFYKNIQKINEWYCKHKMIDPYDIAIEFYVRALSQPQLFFEGNHRTENIVLNYILAGYNKPPFILGVDNAFDYFQNSAKIKHSKRDNVSLLFSFREPKKNLKNLLLTHGKDDFFIL